MKRIGILGSGNVGRTLADGFIKHGYEVKMGTGNPDKLSDWLENAGDQGSVGTFKEAAAFGDLLVLAVKGIVAEKLLGEVKAEISGKTIIDATNPIANGFQACHLSCSHGPPSDVSLPGAHGRTI